MIAQPTTSTTASPLAGLEQEVVLLRSKLDDALGRIQSLEQRFAAASQEDNNAPASIREEHQLVVRDSDEMRLGLRLCDEMFPGSTTELAVDFDPSEPHWKWYTFTVRWTGEVRESIDRQMEWHQRLAQAHPQIGDQFRMIVDLQ